tara:strand:+ start:196 stop:489 length:294 start_codon:yes stop_codon:yes gene_type:complete
MKQVDFSPLEKILMEKAGEPGRGSGGALVQLLVGAILCSLLVFALLKAVSPVVVFWASLVYVVLSTVERIASGWAIAAHKKLVRKLVQHVAGSGRKS